MKKFTCLAGPLVLLACVLLSGCGGDGNSTHPSSPGPAPMGTGSNPNSVTMSVGDKITVRLSGVPDEGYFNEIQIPASGEITLPLLTQPIRAAGLTPAELQSQITDLYKSQKIYTNPVVAVLPEERYVIVEGDVRGPTNVIWRPDSTMMSVINQCGGFTDYADRHHVRIIRGQQVLHYDAVQAIQSPGADPAVLPGDQIYVPRTMF
jgi:protein involved in polysaccharide export with SLBB domain